MLQIRAMGIPCQVLVTTYKVTPPCGGSVHFCYSDGDWYGETTLEYEIYDRKGYRAAWLENKVDKADKWDTIDVQIIEQLEN